MRLTGLDNKNKIKRFMNPKCGLCVGVDTSRPDASLKTIDL